ncbi:MAG: pyrroline-5-carboxylate reductase [Leptolyngbyaceae cyanobacterium bins.59]|nr:pyrroline-5-carboxylate reductase [Leptolyngbyaceae cyanobacterium bins.59]
MSAKLGIIGGGVMGEALLSRLVTQKIYLPSEILVSEPQTQRRAMLEQKYGVSTTSHNDLAVRSEVLLLAVKPQIFDIAVLDLQLDVTSEANHPLPLVLSILAGVSLKRLESAFPGQPVIRAMPNTPATVGAGITAIAAGQHVQPYHLERAETIFKAVGEVVEVPEYLLDAVTGLSGSGPGYVAVAIEALIDGGVAAGLPRPIATKLALQTILGTATLLLETGIHPAELKDRVTSPGGTTIAGIAKLEGSGFRSALIEAVKAASDRARELGS